MAKLQLRLLGGFLLRDAARPRPLPARKAQALLAYLALRAGRAHARPALTGLLWSETGDKQSRQSLRQTMVRLRRALASAHRTALVVQADTVTLNPAAVDVDVVQFERLVRRGTPEALQTAVALYQGPLLDGFRVDEAPFEEWLDSERARLHELAVDALRRLLARHARTGRVEPAVETATRLVTLDPLQEDAHRTLMRLYAKQGRRAAALRQYQACVAIQQKELGVEPEPETKRLYLEILQRAAPPPRRPAGGRVAPAGPAAETPLVGRDTEAVLLRERLALASRGKGQVAVITGEAGIGKSRLVAELASDAAARGIRVLLGRAHETEQILPFRPWIDALRAGRALVDLDGGARARATRTELVRLFPELAGGGGAPTITNESHVRLFESLDAVIDELAMTTPLLVVIEDLHWADDMTLRLLPFIGRRLAGRRVVLACTAREEDATPGVQRTMREMAALPHVTPVALGALSKDATAALVRALARSGSPDARLADTIERVWELSEGSPFVIVETVRALRDARLPDARDVGLPQRVRDLIAARIARLSPRAQELARIAAVFTRSFEFPVLQRAAGLARRETAEAVEELVRQRIVDAVGERFDFTHARIRQAVGDSLLAPRRQALHAAIGEAVETVYAGRLEDSYERLAYHFSRADEPARALTYLVHLADKVARSYALEEAVRVLHEALPFTDRIPSPERERRRVDVVYRLGHVLMLLGRSAEARDLLTNHEAMVASLRDPSTSGAFHFWLAHAYGNLGEGASGLHHGQRALEEAARGGDELMMGRANFVLARETYMAGRALEGIAHGRQAVALLERHRDQWWLGQAIYILALNLLHVGDFTTALEVADRGFALGETNGDTRLLAYAAGIAARVHTVMGEVDAAIGTAQRSAAFASDPVARLTAVGWLGAAYQEGGDSSRAITFLEDALGDLQALSGGGGYRYRQIDAFLRATLSEAYLDQGDVARAHDIASAAVAAATEGGWAVAIGYAARATGRALLAAGKVDEAEAAVRQALRAFADAATHAQVARTRLALAEVMAARGDAAAARAELGTAREAFVHMRAPVLVERTERLAALHALPLA